MVKLNLLFSEELVSLLNENGLFFIRTISDPAQISFREGFTIHGASVVSYCARTFPN